MNSRKQAPSAVVAVLFLASTLMLALGCAESTPPTATSEGDGETLDSSALDLILSNGRVMDPESGTDAVLNVGIKDGRVVLCTEDPIVDRLAEDGVEVDVSGLVVAPGFIDLHAHGQSVDAALYRARDGVTTALEMEWGYPRLAAWLENKKGKSIVHYGATVAHGMVRAAVMDAPDKSSDWADRLEQAFGEAAASGEPLRAFQGPVAASFPLALPVDRYEPLRAELERGLAEGALGIGMAHAYYPGVTRGEIFEVFRFAAEKQVPIYTHVRSMGIEPHQEVLADAAITGAPLHIVHINSTSLGDLPVVLAMVEAAQKQGLDVSAEAYPYTAGSTALNSALFDPGWQERLGIDYGDIQWEETGERLTAQTFERYRKRGGTVIIHMMKEEWIDLAMATDFVMIASDAMPYAPLAHPRSAGTYARVLGRYVRERQAVDLMTALRKMTLMPAQRLEGVAPMMKKKGRLSVGADADITVFDPQTVIDRATFEDGLAFSVGIEHVLVDGTFVVRDGENVPDVFPGKAIVGR